MSNYRMVIEDTDLHEGWNYDFESPSDRMAMDSAKAYAMMFSVCRWFKRIILWNLAYDKPLCSVYVRTTVEAIVKVNK